jgi:hypothetical protein
MTQFECDPPISIAALIFNTNILYLSSFFAVFLRFTEILQVIVITASGDLRCYQKHCQWIFTP